MKQYWDKVNEFNDDNYEMITEPKPDQHIDTVCEFLDNEEEGFNYWVDEYIEYDNEENEYDL